MKYSILEILLLLSFSLVVHAQPTITTSWIGEPGDEVLTVRSTTIPDVGATGEHVVWDFSELKPNNTGWLGSDVKAKYVDVTTTPYFADFPNANSCLLKEYEKWVLMGIMRVEEYEYRRASKGGLELLGTRIKGSFGDAPLSDMTYSDPKSIISFPFGYGSTFDDEFIGEGSGLGGFLDTLSYSVGSLHLEGDAYGTVLLPNGSIENCLRVSSTEFRLDTLHEFGRVVFVDAVVQRYLWVSPSIPVPVAVYEKTIKEVTSVPDGGVPSTATLYDSVFSYNPMVVVSTDELADDKDPRLRVFPNPFLGYINVEYKLETAGEALFNVFSSTGQLVYSRTLKGVHGTNSVQIDLGWLTAGQYVGVLNLGEDKASVFFVKVN